jgi:NAD(P)-dependent dehydrogenase (short-subunit alcohol dehydrogenase family)
MSLEGRVAIITGGGTGIGLGIAEVLAKRHVRLSLAQPTVGIAQIAAARLGEVEVLTIEVDIRSPKSVECMVENTVKRFGGIDILINNASVTGMPAVVPFLESTPAKVDEIVDTNLKGTFYCSQAVAKHMVTTGHGGNIVHIASVGAYAAQEFASLYCATKAAQISMTQTMALELAPHKIRVNCVAPGDIYTDASAAIAEDKKQLGATDRFVRATPLGHRGRPGDIGHAVAYLVSDEAEFVTGATLVVDGGFLTY